MTPALVLHWHPEVAAGLTALLAFYLYATGPLRRRHHLGPPVRVGQRLAFVGGILLTAGALLGPLAEWAEFAALSAHMAQHLLLTLAVPVLWLLGTPAWLLRPLLRVPALARAGRLLTRPGVALALSGATLAVWHMPACFEAAMARQGLHILMHVSLLGTALLAWWPLCGPLPEWPQPAPPGQLAYLLVAMVAMTAVAAPVTVAENVLYPYYQAAPRAWPLEPRLDQEVAGILMWMGGLVAYLIAGTLVFFRWAAREGGEEPVGEEVGDGARG
jgi:putative membrane protein